jgi:hypothetical protein
MLTIPRDVFNAHILPYLDGRHVLSLSLVCKEWAQWVESNPLLKRCIRWHWIQLDDVSELKPWLELARPQKRLRFDDFPHIGENQQHHSNFTISDFYTKSHILDMLISDIAKTTNKWRFFTYPPLKGLGRWRCGPLSFHRGGSIQLW